MKINYDLYKLYIFLFFKQLINKGKMYSKFNLRIQDGTHNGMQ
jgi:hypothetical protein